MRPPICAVCHARFGEDGGGLVSFAKDDDARAFARRRHDERGFVGHPPEKEWFCGAHIAAARALAHLTKAEAMAQLASQPQT
jgi:hypothetical protein